MLAGFIVMANATPSASPELVAGSRRMLAGGMTRRWRGLGISRHGLVEHALQPRAIDAEVRAAGEQQDHAKQPCIDVTLCEATTSGDAQHIETRGREAHQAHREELRGVAQGIVPLERFGDGARTHAARHGEFDDGRDTRGDDECQEMNEKGKMVGVHGKLDVFGGEPGQCTCLGYSNGLLRQAAFSAVYMFRLTVDPGYTSTHGRATNPARTHRAATPYR